MRPGHLPYSEPHKELLKRFELSDGVPEWETEGMVPERGLSSGSGPRIIKES